MRLRTYLIALVAATLLPVLAFAGWSAWRAVAAERIVAARELARLATSAAGALEVEFGRAIVLGRTLAASPALRRGDLETFALQAREAAEANGTSVAIGGEDGRQTFNSRVPAGMPIDARPSPELVRQVRERGGPFVTDLFPAPLMDRPIAAVIVPVHGAPADIAVAIGVRVDTARLARLLPEPVFGAGAFSLALDGRGTVAARSGAAPEHFPMRALDGWAPGQVGLIEGGAGARLLAARSMIADTGWQVIVVAPEHAVAAGARGAVVWLAAAGVGGLLLAVLLSVLLAAFLLRQARGLVATASAMAEGGAVSDDSRVTEVAVLRRALEAAGGAIRSRAEAQARLHAMTETASLLEQRVAERTRDLEQATGRLLDAEDEVRRRIARDLHDSTVQELVAASLYIAHARAAPAGGGAGAGRCRRRAGAGQGGTADRILPVAAPLARRMRACGGVASVCRGRGAAQRCRDQRRGAVRHAEIVAIRRDGAVPRCAGSLGECGFAWRGTKHSGAHHPRSTGSRRRGHRRRPRHDAPWA